MMRVKMMAGGVLAAGSMVLCGCSKNSAQKELGSIVLELPSSGSESSSPFPGFSWSEHAEAFRDVGKPVEYEIQIASDAAFKILVDEDRVALNRYVHDKPLPTGSYYWRVRAIPHSGEATTRKVTVKIEPGFPGLDASDNPAHDVMYLLEPGSEGRLKSGVRNFFRSKGAFTKEDEDVWSFAIGTDFDRWTMGDRFAYNFRSESLHLVDFSESRGLTAYGLTTAGWGGMQYVSIEGDDFRILNCKKRFDESKWMTGNADGVHIRGHRIGAWIEGMSIQAIGDDSIALYARPAWMKSVVAGENSRKVICRQEFFNLEEGDEVSFFQPMTGEILLETTVESVKPVDGGFEVSFADPVPEQIRFEGPVQQATQIWNRSKSCGDFMVRDCEFTNIRRYGTVFRSKRGVIENNRYRGISARAIVFINGTAWPNGLYASEIAAGKVRDDLVEHIDLAATSLALAGAAVPEWMQGDDLYAADYQPKDAVFAARDRCGETVDMIRSVRTKRHKYVRNFFPDRPLLQPTNYKDTKDILIRLRELHEAGTLNEVQEDLLFAPKRSAEELYDIEADPHETVNLARDPKNTELLGAMRSRLEHWMKDTRDLGPEFPEVYVIEMEFQISKNRREPKGLEAVKRNVDLMTRWQQERPYRPEMIGN